MSRAGRWLAVGAMTGLALATFSLAPQAGLARLGQATEPYPTLPPTRPFPTLPSNVPSPAVTASTPATATATPPTPESPTPRPSETATSPPSATPTSTITVTPSVTPTPSATRYLDLGRVMHLPYSAQFATLVPGPTARRPGRLRAGPPP